MGQDHFEDAAKSIDASREAFLKSWRESEFYPFVIKIIEDEMHNVALQELMALAYSEGRPLDDQEIGQQAKIDFQVKLRIESNILEKLK